MSILIVEHDLQLAVALLRRLRDEHDVFPVSSAEAALETLAGYPYDLVISDHNLAPGEMTGLELLAIVAQRWPAARRVLFTGQSVDGWKEHAHVLIQKPCTLDELIAKLGLSTDKT